MAFNETPDAGNFIYNYFDVGGTKISFTNNLVVHSTSIEVKIYSNTAHLLNVYIILKKIMGRDITQKKQTLNKKKIITNGIN